MDISKLVMESKKGNIKAFMELIENEQNRLYSIAFTYFKNQYDAEDIISQTAIKAFYKIRQLRDEKKFYAWFISILANECNGRYNSTVIRMTEYGTEMDNGYILKDRGYLVIVDEKTLEKNGVILSDQDRDCDLDNKIKDYETREDYYKACQGINKYCVFTLDAVVANPRLSVTSEEFIKILDIDVNEIDTRHLKSN